MSRISRKRRASVSLVLVWALALSPGCSVCSSAWNYGQDNCPSFEEVGALCVAVGVVALGFFAGGGGGHGHYHAGYRGSGYHGYSNHCR